MIHRSVARRVYSQNRPSAPPQRLVDLAEWSWRMEDIRMEYGSLFHNHMVVSLRFME